MPNISQLATLFHVAADTLVAFSNSTLSIAQAQVLLPKPMSHMTLFLKATICFFLFISVPQLLATVNVIT